MGTNKTSSIKELDAIRRNIIKSNFNEKSKIIDELKKAYAIAQNAPLREMMKYDGTTFTNFDERNMLLTFLDRELKELEYINEESYPYYRFQITSTVVMLMVSISDYGLTEIEKIINNP